MNPESISDGISLATEGISFGEFPAIYLRLLIGPRGIQMTSAHWEVVVDIRIDRLRLRMGQVVNLDRAQWPSKRFGSVDMDSMAHQV